MTIEKFGGSISDFFFHFCIEFIYDIVSSINNYS